MVMITLHLVLDYMATSSLIKVDIIFSLIIAEAHKQSSRFAYCACVRGHNIMCARTAAS